ncbi:polysialyltransferase family glycosyltransferase [Vibrio sp. SCSIO 43137]|uniref:polysialyltransferase family glycosyltransferase n=1 Tax=Vibrio sp. SCSIO 43137 TaxID=3021011 RepID=UPI002307713B|nr:polysialyltransferase family glycosyltransferase [Vibrio sp. SCSIO 43137]WCE29857.1 polysialyltransferase family glycosyltransferase [Vibrio sp. SCSIO 43137]
MNLFLVTSPFQYICAVEAREQYNTRNNILVLVEQDNEAGKRHMDQLFNDEPWDVVIKVKRSNRTFITPRLIKSIQHMAKRKPLEYFFFAEYKSWRTRMFLRNITAEKLVLIDDGMANLYEYYQYIEPKKTFKRTRWLQDFLVQLQGCKKIGVMPYDEKLEMFSIFNISNTVCVLKLNKLESLRKTIGASKCFDANAEIAFIGEGAIGDKNQPDIESYVSRLENLAKNSSSDILYFPHRTESEKVTKAIKSLPYIIYHNSEFPIELEIANKNIKLSKIYGVTSTALYTLSLLYKEIPISAHTYDSHVGNKMIAFLKEHFAKRQL